MDALPGGEENLWVRGRRVIHKCVTTVDDKRLEFIKNGPNVRVWLKGPLGGYRGTCLLDLQDIEAIMAILNDHINSHDHG